MQVHGVQLDVQKMAKRLWGDVYYHPTTRTFKSSPPAADSLASRTFVEFILEPLYKIYSQVQFQGVRDFGFFLRGVHPGAPVQDLQPGAVSGLNRF